VALAVGLHTAAGAAIDGIEDTTVRVMAKLEQILPDHLRRRVDALNSSVEVLRWSPKTPVPSATLGVLATGCRDREEVRFEYTRRDGETARRLVQPNQLVSVGHRWYLVGWDVRRTDWRTFRVDRMVEPRLAGVRFEPRQLPAASAAEFVAAGLRSATQQYEAIVVVVGEPDRIESVRRWFGGQLEPIDGSPHRMRLGADALEWLASMIAILSVSFDVTVESAPEKVTELLATACSRLGALAP
jgi:predicted DNA-binding transcriptional regulator YafY